MNAAPEGPASAQTRKVFISYRREDSAAYAGRLYDAMVARFGEGNVFMDLDLAPGVDFVDRITEAVSACQILIEVIGPTWATVKDAEGRTRITDHEDFVRLELEIALKRPEVTVIPVLVGGAEMPHRRELPPELAAVTRRNALELSDQRWRYDVGRLGSALEQLLAGGTAAEEPVPPPSPPPPRTQAKEPAEAREGAAGGEQSGAAGEARAPTAADETAPAAHRGRSRRGLALAGVLALAVAAIALVVALSGGGSGDGGQGSLEYIRFTTSAFSVDVPEGWKLDENERQLDPTTTRTSFNSPSQQMRVEVVQESDLPPATRANEAQTERSQDRGYSRITISPQTVNGREARLFGYEIDDKTLDYQPSTAYTYFFNAGESGWRTRAVGARADVSADTVLAIATRMAESLEPR